MNHRKLYSLLLFLITWWSVGQPDVQAQEKGNWWPHPIWGAEDQAGGSNWMTPEKVMEALSIVKTGKMYELGFIYQNGMP